MPIQGVYIALRLTLVLTLRAFPLPSRRRNSPGSFFTPRRAATVIGGAISTELCFKYAI